MSILKPGTLCVTVGSSGDIGRIVRVISYYPGPFRDETVTEGYHIRTASGRPFATITRYTDNNGPQTIRNIFSECIADRSNLRPLVDPKVEAEESAQKQADKAREDGYVDAHLVPVQA